MKFIISLLFLIITFNTSIEIENAWIRPSFKGMNSALFFTVVNNSDKPDTLYKVSSDVAELVQMHETFKKDNEMMGMREVKNVIIEPNSKFKFKPKAHHVMLMKLNEDLSVKNEVDIIFYFKQAGEINMKIPVLDKF